MITRLNLLILIGAKIIQTYLKSCRHCDIIELPNRALGRSVILKLQTQSILAFVHLGYGKYICYQESLLLRVANNVTKTSCEHNCKVRSSRQCYQSLKAVYTNDFDRSEICSEPQRACCEQLKNEVKPIRTDFDRLLFPVQQVFGFVEF